MAITRKDSNKVFRSNMRSLRYLFMVMVGQKPLSNLSNLILIFFSESLPITEIISIIKKNKKDSKPINDYLLASIMTQSILFYYYNIFCWGK